MSVVADHVSFFRTEWEERINNSGTTCTVTRYDFDNPTFNDVTGETEYPTSNPLTDAPCLVRPAQASEADFGEDRRQEVDYDLFLLVGTADLQEQDEVAFTSTVDPDLPTVTVLRPFQDSYLTKRHYETKAVTDA